MHKTIVIFLLLTIYAGMISVTGQNYKLSDSLLYKEIDFTTLEIQSNPWTEGCDSVYIPHQNKILYYNSDLLFHQIATRPLNEIYKEVLNYYFILEKSVPDVSKQEICRWQTEREKLVNAAKRYKSKALRQELDVFDVTQHTFNTTVGTERWEYHWSLVEKYDRKKDFQTKLRILERLLFFCGSYYTVVVAEQIKDRRIPVMKVINEILSTLERINGKPNIALSNHYFYVGLIYFDFKFYDKAVPLFWKALDEPHYGFFDRAQMQARDYLGAYYRMIGNYDLSDSLYFSILQSPDKVNYLLVYETVAIGGLARNAMLRGEDEEAIRLYSVAFPRALLVKDTTLAGGYAVHLGRLFLQKNQLQKTEELLYLAQKYVNTPYNLVRNRKICYTLGRDYYLKINNIEKATAYIDSIAAIQKLEDEIYNTRLLAHSEQEAFEFEKALKKEKIRVQKARLIFITVILVLTTAALVFLIFAYRIKQRKNIALYRQIKEQDRLVAELEQLSAMKKRNSVLLHKSGNQKQQQLVDKLQNYLLLNRIFTKFDIGYQEITLALATNKTYLFDAIKAVTGKTLQEYINDLRLNEAKKMFDLKCKYSIERIADECGFFSYRTFYRLFKKRFQLSPTEYNRMAKEVEIIDN